MTAHAWGCIATPAMMHCGSVDPRFSDLCGKYDPNLFDQSYDFISEKKASELTELKKRLKREKDVDVLEQLKVCGGIQLLHNHEIIFGGCL